MIFAGASLGTLPTTARTSLQLGNSTGNAGESITVPLHLFTSDVVSAAQVDLATNPNIAAIAKVTAAEAGAHHIVDSELLEAGKTRVVIYSTRNDFLFSEALISVQLVLRSKVDVNGRAIRVDSVKLADDGAGFVDTALVPHATFAGPDASVVYKMGDSVNASSTAYGTGEEVDRVEFLVNGLPAVSDSEAPYEMHVPLQYFGSVTLSARAVDREGNRFESLSEKYVVTFPPTLEDWLDIFFSPAEQLDPDVGALSADVDFDHLATLAEYAMGLHPRTRDGPRESGFLRNAQTGAYQFGYSRPVGVEGLSYTLQLSDDLSDWSPAGPNASMEVIPVSNYFEEVRFSLPDLQAPRQFGRVLIEKVDP